MPVARPTVSFVADLVCPWCYIAFMRLQRAARHGRRNPGLAPVPAQPASAAGGVTRLAVSRAPVRQRRPGSGRASPRRPGRRRARASRSPSGHPRPAQHHRRRMPWCWRLPPSGRQIEAAAALFRAFFADRRRSRRAAVLGAIAAELGLGPPRRSPRRWTGGGAAWSPAHERAFALGHRRRAGVRSRRRPCDRRRAAGRGAGGAAGSGALSPGAAARPAITAATPRSRP